MTPPRRCPTIESGNGHCGRGLIGSWALAAAKPTAPTDETRTAGVGKLTEAGVILGSAPYMSPEQTEGRQVDARSGIFSLGSVLYELFSGKRPARANREYPRSPPSSRKIPRRSAIKSRRNSSRRGAA